MAVVAMAPSVTDAQQMEKLRELIKALLGVSAIPADLADLVSKLFSNLHEIERRCPKLSCHLHVSGVSQTTGRSFFIVLYDAALTVNEGAKRVIKSVYTHLLSDRSMAMTAALWRQSLARPPAAPVAYAVAGAQPVAATEPDVSRTQGDAGGPASPARTSGGTPALASGSPAAGRGAPVHLSADVAPAALQAAKDALAHDPDGGSVLRGASDDAARPPGAANGPQGLDSGRDGASGLDGAPTGGSGLGGVLDGGAGRDDAPKGVAARGGVATGAALQLGSASSAPSSATSHGFGGLTELGVLTSRFEKPQVHVPSAWAAACVEALFSAMKKGWAGLIRATMAEARSVLCARYNIANKPKVQGMLAWWPIDLDSAPVDVAVGDTSPDKRGRRGKPAKQCINFSFPVAVQKRHLPEEQRSREIENMETMVIMVSGVNPPRSSVLHEVVAALLLLIDKEQCVSDLLVRKLAEYGIVPCASGQDAGEDALDEVDRNDDRLTDGFLSSSRRPSPAGSSSPLPPTGTGPPSAQQGIQNNGAPNAVAARLAARQAAGAAGLLEAAAAKLTAASKKAQLSTRLPRKRGSAANTPAGKKRQRVGAEHDGHEAARAADFVIPDLQPAMEVIVLPLLEEAAMIETHTYLTLATNWHFPVVDTRNPLTEVLEATQAEWPAIVAGQRDVNCILDVGSLRKVRKELMVKAEDMRARNEIDADHECPVYAKVVARDESEEQLKKASGEETDQQHVSRPDKPVRQVQLTLPTLQAMDQLLVAADRLEHLRATVSWLLEVVSLPNSRVPSYVGDERKSMGVMATEVMQRLLACNPTTTVWRLGTPATGAMDEDVVVPAHLIVSTLQATWMADDIITVNTLILQRHCQTAGSRVCVVQCSLMSRILAAQDSDLGALVDEVRILMGASTAFAGVCNISRSHWIAFSVDLASKTVTTYDSGTHFVSLKDAVRVARKRFMQFGKEMRQHMEKVDGEEVASTDGVQGVGQKSKAWSPRLIKTPAQNDTCSCGPFSFSFVWNVARGQPCTVLTSDGHALRLEMVAAVVRDGIEQDHALSMRGTTAQAAAASSQVEL